jgi:hypothetical protein
MSSQRTLRTLRASLLGAAAAFRICEDGMGESQPHSVAASERPESLRAWAASWFWMMILLLLFLQKQSLAFAVYLFGIGTLHTGPGLKKKKHM